MHPAVALMARNTKPHPKNIHSERVTDPFPPDSIPNTKSHENPAPTEVDKITFNIARTFFISVVYHPSLRIKGTRSTGLCSPCLIFPFISYRHKFGIRLLKIEMSFDPCVVLDAVYNDVEHVFPNAEFCLDECNQFLTIIR